MRPPLQMQRTIPCSLCRRAGSPLETPSGPTTFPFANGRMTSVISCIVASTPILVSSGQLSRPSVMFRSSFGELTFRRVWNHWTHPFVDGFNVPIILRNCRLWCRLCHGFPSLPSSLSLGACRSRPDCLLKLVFEFADESPEEAPHSRLASFPAVHASHLVKAPPFLLFLLPCSLHPSRPTIIRAPALCSTQEL